MKTSPLSLTSLHKNQGFTLIELLVSMALFGILSAILITVFVWVNNSYNRAVYLSNMQTQGSQAVETLERAIRSAVEAEVLLSSHAACLGTQCLLLHLATESIEYKQNGGCHYTIYAWYSSTHQMTRYYRNKAGSGYAPCGAAGEHSLFDRTAVSGIDATLALGASHMFELMEGSSGFDAVKINLLLKQGANNSWPGNQANRPEVYFVTTANLRNY